MNVISQVEMRSSSGPLIHMTGDKTGGGWGQTREGRGHVMKEAELTGEMQPKAKDSRVAATSRRWEEAVRILPGVSGSTACSETPGFGTCSPRSVRD